MGSIFLVVVVFRLVTGFGKMAITIHPKPIAEPQRFCCCLSILDTALSGGCLIVGVRVGEFGAWMTGLRYRRCCCSYPCSSSWPTRLPVPSAAIRTSGGSVWARSYPRTYAGLWAGGSAGVSGSRRGQTLIPIPGKCSFSTTIPASRTAFSSA